MSTRDTVMSWDRAAGDRLTGYRSTPAMKVLAPVSDIADQWPLFSLCALVTVIGLTRRDRKLATTGAEMTLAMLTATVLKNVVKDRVDRTRPSVIADGGSYVFQPGDHDVTELDGFPSGHTAGGVAVAQVVGRRYPDRRRFALATAGTAAVIQIPRGKHYPTDLVAGAVVGFVAERCARLIWKLFERAS